MVMKEKCVYYDNNTKCYYLVVSKDDKMIYGRRGDMENPKYLDTYMGSASTDGLKYKINDDIVIYDDYIRNYRLDEKDLENFEFITELSDDEFNLFKVFTFSNFKFPNNTIDLKPSSSKFKDHIYNITKLKREIDESRNKLNKMTVKLFRLLEEGNKK